MDGSAVKKFLPHCRYALDSSSAIITVLPIRSCQRAYRPLPVSLLPSFSSTATLADKTSGLECYPLYTTKEFAMKMFVLPLVLIVLTGSPCLAENVEEEAINSLVAAQQLVQGGNYKKAMEEVNYAIAKINELTAADLLKYVPDPPEGFNLVNKQSQGIGVNDALAGSAGATAEYSNDNGSIIGLKIAIGGVTGKMAGLAALGSIFAGLNQDGGAGQTRQVRVLGYTGTEVYNASEMRGTLTFQIGENTSVTIEGSNIESAAALMQLAKKMDLAGIEKGF
jgi:hypothetical protein